MKKAQPLAYKTGTLVLKKDFENITKKETGKLQANWKGPYVMTKVGDSGAYHL